MEKTYVINQKEFVQRPLSIGQIAPLIESLKDIDLPEKTTALEIISLLEGRFPYLLAVVLRAGGESLREKNIEALEEFFADGVEIPTAVQIVADFFELNAHLQESLFSFSETFNKAAAIKEAAAEAAG